jgi:hypothetical protein
MSSALSPSVAGSASRLRTERRTGANAASGRADDVAGRCGQTAPANTTTQRRNKQTRVATVSAPAIAEPPADTPPTPPDIQPCASEGLHRTMDGIVTDRPPRGRAVVGEGKARAVRRLADEQGLDLERSFAYSNGDKDVPFLETIGNPVAVSPERGLRAGAQRGRWLVLRREGRPATPGLPELARTAAFYGGMFTGVEAGLGVDLLRHSRRERVDIGGGRRGSRARAGRHRRASRVGRRAPMVGAAVRVRVRPPEQARPDPDHEVAGRVHGRGEEGGCHRSVPETRFGRDLGFRWALYVKNSSGGRFPFARLGRDPPGLADQG